MFDNPSVRLCINRQWCPLLSGVMDVLTLADYWPGSMSLSGPAAIERIIARLNAPADFFGCTGPDGDFESEAGASWCTYIDLTESDGLMVGDAYNQCGAALGITTDWAAGVGFTGEITEVPGAHGNLSCLSVKFDPGVIWHPLTVQLVLERAVGYTDSECNGSVDFDGVDHAFGCVVTAPSLFIDQDVVVMHIILGAFADHNVGDSLTHANILKAIKVTGTGVSPWGISNC